MRFDKTKCGNFIRDRDFYRTAFQCHRQLTGADGLCNVCRAAKSRGNKRSEVANLKRRASDDASAARHEIVILAISYRKSGKPASLKKLLAAVDRLEDAKKAIGRSANG